MVASSTVPPPLSVTFTLSGTKVVPSKATLIEPSVVFVAVGVTVSTLASRPATVCCVTLRLTEDRSCVRSPRPLRPGPFVLGLGLADAPVSAGSAYWVAVLEVLS